MRMAETARKLLKSITGLSLTSLIWIGLSLGLILGLFIGEYTAKLGVVGDIYVGLLQMTVLPYIVVSLIGNIGRMTLKEARILAGKGLIVLILLWGIGAVMVMLLGMAFPTFSSGSFFSTSLVEKAAPIDLVELFVPSNPFKSLSANLVPAVVLFCILFGVAAIGSDNKQPFLNQFELIAQILRRMNGFIIKLTPLGIFAITANAAGTLTIDEFGRLQGYLLTYTLGGLIITFWILPAIISTLTPFSYRDVLSASKNAIITAFIVNSTFVVIPMLIEATHQLFTKDADAEQPSQIKPEFIIPLGYPFPDIGKIVTLIFIPFVSWFYTGTISMAAYAFILPVGMVLSFGNIITTIPFLLDAQQLPADAMQLFFLSGVWAARVGDLMAAMHLFTFTILTTMAIHGRVRIRWSKIALSTGVFIVLSVIGIVGTRMILEFRFKDSYRKDQVIASMQLFEPLVDNVLMPTSEHNPVKLEPGQSRLDRIQQRGIVRIGYNPDRLPYSYKNPKGELVGFDVDLVNAFAFDLGVDIEFVPYTLENLERTLKEDHFDFAISGITSTLERAKRMAFTSEYLTVNQALIVKSYRRDDFSNYHSMLESGPLRMGVIADGVVFANRLFKKAKNITLVELPSEKGFFEDESLDLDALSTTAEGGSAWTLLYPGYTVVVPYRLDKRVPLVWALPGEDPEFESYINNWIQLNQLDGTIDKLVNYWIYGRAETSTKSRWCILRDVLHWID